ADGFSAFGPFAGSPCPVSFESSGPTSGRSGPARVDTPVTGAYNRCKLFRHGRHVWPQGGKLRAFPPGRPADVGGTQQAAGAFRVHRVQSVPAANGRQRPETHFAPGSISRARLRPYA